MSAHAKAEFFSGSQYLGQGMLRLTFIKGELERPISRAFFCPICGEVWARVVVEGASEFQSYTRTCARHDPRWSIEIPGSIWISWDRDFQDAFPSEALKREVRLHLDHAQWDLQRGRQWQETTTA